MRTLDKYIVGNFLFTALLMLIIMMSLRVVVDLFVNMDEFTKLGKPFGQTMADIATYYSYQSLAYLIELGGVIIVSAATFSIARMNQSNELTAMLASGVSLYRVIWPIILCAMLMGGILIIDQELIIPRVADKLVRSRDDVPGTEYFAVRLTPDETGAVWYSTCFKPAEETMRNPLVIIRYADYCLLATITARVARAGTIDGRKGWVLSDATLSRAGKSGSAWPRTPDATKIFTDVGPETLLRLSGQPAKGQTAVRDIFARDPQYGMVIRAERFVPEPPVEGRPREGRLIGPRFTFKSSKGKILAVFPASSAQWHPGELGKSYWALTGGIVFYPTPLTTEDLMLRRDSDWLDFMSSSKLSKLLKLRRAGDENTARLTKHIRVTEPINNLIMLLLGLPFILSRERNLKASASLCLLTVGTFYAFIYISRYIGLDPSWAAWLPILLFGPVAVVMLDTIKT